jgi:hypothetical protein
MIERLLIEVLALRLSLNISAPPMTVARPQTDEVDGSPYLQGNRLFAASAKTTSGCAVHRASFAIGTGG